MKRIYTWMIILAVFFTSSLSVFAAKGNVTFVGNANKFVFAPGSKYSPTDLFPEFKDVMPGDSISQFIKLKNDTSNKVKVMLYMRSLGADDRSKNFLSQLNMRVLTEDHTELFDADADEKAQLKDWTYLGTLYSGGEVELEVVLDVPTSLGNEFSNEKGKITWEFRAIEYEIEPTDPKPPRTGDSANILLWGGCLVVAGAAIVILKRRKDK